VLRVLIEKRGSDPRYGSGVDHALCAAVSRDLSEAIDVEDAIIDAFVLEVSSPGIERPLTRLADYERFAGREARVETSAPVAGCKRFGGKLLGVRGEDVKLAKADGEIAVIPFQKIAKAHLVYEKSEMISRAGEK
jgi:ribosome maturation factor RimP